MRFYYFSCLPKGEHIISTMQGLFVAIYGEVEYNKL